MKKCNHYLCILWFKYWQENLLIHQLHNFHRADFLHWTHGSNFPSFEIGETSPWEWTININVLLLVYCKNHKFERRAQYKLFIRIYRMPGRPASFRIQSRSSHSKIVELGIQICCRRKIVLTSKPLYYHTLQSTHSCYPHSLHKFHMSLWHIWQFEPCDFAQQFFLSPSPDNQPDRQVRNLQHI